MAFQNSPPQPEQQMETNLSSTSRQNQKIDDVGGRLIKGMLVRKEPRPSQSSTLVQPEPRVEPSEAENYKRPPRAGYRGLGLGFLSPFYHPKLG